MSFCKICSTLHCDSINCATIIKDQAESIARRASQISNESAPGQLKRELNQVYQWAGKNGYDLAADWIQLAALEPGSGVVLKLADDSGPATPMQALERALARLDDLATTFHARKQVRVAKRALLELENSVKAAFRK